MPKLTLRLRGTRRIARWAVLAGVLAAAGAAPLAQARPDVDRDAVRRFLAQHGLVETRPAADPAVGAAPAPATPTLPMTPADDGGGLVDQMRDRASEMVISAMNFLGVPYRRGGNSADSGFDCSGFTRHVFEQSVGLLLPRRADAQATAAGLQAISRSELKPGDLVFFNTLRRTFSHVGIYIGDGKFIHAPRTGQTVRIDNLDQRYWSQRFTGARRAELNGTAVDAAALGLGDGSRIGARAGD